MPCIFELEITRHINQLVSTKLNVMGQHIMKCTEANSYSVKYDLDAKNITEII